MECPRCHGRTEVLETRVVKGTPRRRRQCDMGHRFWTMETTVREVRQVRETKPLREKAYELLSKGFAAKRVAHELSVGIETIYRWRRSKGAA